MRSDLIADAYLKFGVRVLGVGARDLALGPQKLNEIKKLGKFAFVGTNFRVKDVSIAKYHIENTVSSVMSKIHS